MANCPQINNTTIKGTSAVSYDSTPLPCTDVNTCDGLNVILSKFNDVICSATASVNILIEEVTNITEDIMIITDQLEDINNQIFICCPICDFTGTANELPVCDFIGEADQLPDPTTTTTSSSTSTSTSTSTSSSTTTTTTTDEPIPSTTTSTTTFNNYRIEDCITLVTYVLPKTYVFSLGDTVQYQVGVPGAGLQRCGVIISTSSNLPPTASLFGGVSYPCEDTLHCPTS
jgi:hypothetical protein